MAATDIVVRVPNVLREQCPYCGKWRQHSEMTYIAGGAVMCLRCRTENHPDALRTWAPPDECQECHASREELERGEAGPHFRMYVHYKDGRYQILCLTCSDAYAPKRADLYRLTQFGKSIGL